MPTAATTDKVLSRFFRKRRVALLDDLFQLLGIRSRMSVFRRLRKLGYLTSFTHRGRYYTLREIPEFNENGLWFHQGIGFSRAGTLKNTLAELVEAAEAGATHEELRGLVRVRAHYALLELVNARRISRHQLPGQYLYLSANRKRASRQAAEREHMLAGGKPPPELPTPVVISILLEVIYFADVQVDPSDIAARLRVKGTEVSAEQVEQTLERFGIAKKGAP